MSGDAAVSVVIPAWNRADRIEGAILSALEQEPKPLEIIVVDDGSTDGTDAGRLVALDARVRVIRHDANRGAAEARNTGVAAARGDWIAFLDSDDRWLPGKLARQLAQVAGAGEHRLFACGNVLLEGGAYDGRLYNARPPAEGEDISRYFLVHGCTFQTSTLLVPADLARSLRFEGRVAPHEDWDFTLRLLKSGARFVYCHEPVAKYWDAADPARASRRPSITAVLAWLSAARELIAPDAQAALLHTTWQTCIGHGAADAPVSVVIPAYNRADRIEDAIASALDQKPGPLEVIVVDDASTDGTDAARLGALDPRVRVIRHDVNSGAAAARNTGIDAARGEWVAFLDADDRWLPGKLALQLLQAAAAGGRRAFVCSNVLLEGGARDGRLYNARPPEEGEDLSRYFLLHHCTFHTSTLLVPADLARSFRFRRKIRHEDWDFLLRLARDGVRFLYWHQPLARYWDAADPKRNTRRYSFEPTLYWLEVARDLIAPDAAVAYYFREIYWIHRTRSPAAAALLGLRLACRSPRAAAWLARKVLAAGRERLFPGLQARRP